MIVISHRTNMHIYEKIKLNYIILIVRTNIMCSIPNNMMSENGRDHGKKSIDKTDSNDNIGTGNLFIGTGNLFHRKPLKKNKMNERPKQTDRYDAMMSSVANSNPFGKNINSVPKNIEPTTKKQDIDVENVSVDLINTLLRRITLLENELDEYKNYVENTFVKTKNMEKEMEQLEERIMRSID